LSFCFCKFWINFLFFKSNLENWNLVKNFFKEKEKGKVKKEKKKRKKGKKEKKITVEIDCLREVGGEKVELSDGASEIDDLLDPNIPFKVPLNVFFLSFSYDHCYF